MRPITRRSGTPSVQSVPDAPAVYIDIPASVAAMEQGVLIGGVPAMKGVEDLARYKKVLEATRPGLIVQTGTAVGGSALWFAESGARVITIDVDEAAIHPRTREAALVLIGSSTNPHVFAVVRAIADGHERVMVVLDSDHSSAHVRAEIALYGPLVTPGCYLVVEDGIYDFAAPGPFKPGPFDAITDCLVDDPAWKRDTETESLEPVSMYPAGWWVKQ